MKSISLLSVLFTALFLSSAWALFGSGRNLAGRLVVSCSPPCVPGDEAIMKPKAHGTSETPVQSNLQWKCSVKLADRICNFNRRYAEHAGYWEKQTTFLQEENEATAPVTFYDSNTGKPLFQAPGPNRTWRDFVEESRQHGWPSFRDDEVIWDQVRVLPNGETVSTAGTHLGHNIPDHKGNRYCINLVSIAGRPSQGKKVGEL